jgi:hypothetical protein
MEIGGLLINPEKADGVWIDWHDAKLLVRYAESAKVKNAIVKMIIEKRTTGDFDGAEFLAKNQNKIIAQNVLLDWKNIKINGEEFPYNPENAEYLLERVPEVAWLVNTESANASHYREEFKEKIIKNSKRS